MAKIVLDPITSGYQSTTQVNTNNAEIATNLNSLVLYRNNPDGEANEMLNLMDMNSNRIINLPVAISAGEPVTFGQLIDILSTADGDINIPFVTETQTLSAGQTAVVWTSDIVLSVFSISGLSSDSHRLVEGVDYSANTTTRTITLFNSYPSGTTVLRSKEQAADVIATGVGTYPTAAATVTLDANGGAITVFDITLTANATLSIINAPSLSSTVYQPTLRITSGGAFTVTFDAMFVFITTPTLSTTIGERDHISCLTIDNGTTYDCLHTIAAIGP
tara:strand:+ start:3251 stop:4078 length:828 start_codon:yes stop_codon:yes gene_type:complete